MAASTTMTIRISADLKEKLHQLAQDTRRSNSFLAGEALAAYVERELQIVRGIQEGLADVQSGDLVPHEEAMAEIDAIIAAARSREAAHRRKA